MLNKLLLRTNKNPLTSKLINVKSTKMVKD